MAAAVARPLPASALPLAAAPAPAGFMAINQPVAGPLQDPSLAVLAAAAEAAAANTAIMWALRPLPRVRGVSLRWVAGLGRAPGVYQGICLEARAPNVEAALA